MIDFVLEYGFSTKSLDMIPKEYELHQKLGKTPEEFEVYQKWRKKLNFSLLTEYLFKFITSNVSSLYNPCEMNANVRRSNFFVNFEELLTLHRMLTKFSLNTIRSVDDIAEISLNK